MEGSLGYIMKSCLKKGEGKGGEGMRRILSLFTVVSTCCIAKGLERTLSLLDTTGWAHF